MHTVEALQGPLNVTAYMFGTVLAESWHDPIVELFCLGQAVTYYQEMCIWHNHYAHTTQHHLVC